MKSGGVSLTIPGRGGAFTAELERVMTLGDGSEAPPEPVPALNYLHPRALERLRGKDGRR